MFKLDLQELSLRHEREDEYGQSGALLAELSRQIKEAGAPPGDLETQLRALLARPAPIDPGQGMVEALARVAYSVEDRAHGRHPIAFDQLLPEAKDEYMRAQRAVLSALAGMGAEALPTVDIVLIEDDAHDAPINATLRLCSAAIAPILAAKDARIAELEAQLGTATQPTVETLARELHEAGREAVARGLVVNNLGKPFLGWDEITEEAREGRRVQARHLLGKFRIASIGIGYSPPPPPPPPGVIADHVHELGSCTHCDMSARSIGIPDPPPPPPPPSVITEGQLCGKMVRVARDTVLPCTLSALHTGRCCP